MLAYVFVALSRPPQRDLLGKHLPRIDEMLKKQDDTALKTFGNGSSGFMLHITRWVLGRCNDLRVKIWIRWRMFESFALTIPVVQFVLWRDAI